MSYNRQGRRSHLTHRFCLSMWNMWWWSVIPRQLQPAGKLPAPFKEGAACGEGAGLRSKCSLFGKSLLVMEGTVPGSEEQGSGKAGSCSLSSSVSVAVKALKCPRELVSAEQQRTTQKQKQGSLYKVFNSHTHVPSELTECVAVCVPPGFPESQCCPELQGRSGDLQSDSWFRSVCILSVFMLEASSQIWNLGLLIV